MTDRDGPPQGAAGRLDGAGRLIYYRDRLGDLEAALALLGIREATAPEAEELSDNIDILGDLPDDLDDSTDEDDEDQGPMDSPEWIRRRLDDGEYHQWGSSEASQSGTSLPRRSRSIVAYLLPPDMPSPDQRWPRERPRYRSIPDRTHRLEPRRSPGSDAWATAHLASDLGARAKRPWRIDLRASVDLLAQYEPIVQMPRTSRWLPDRDVWMLVDTGTAVGVFAADVEQLIAAFRSISQSQSTVELRIAQLDGDWYAGDGPIWTFSPLHLSATPVNYVLLTGGPDRPTSDLTAPWQELALQIAAAGHGVVVVWLGDRVPSSFGGGVRWISYLET